MRSPRRINIPRKKKHEIEIKSIYISRRAWTVPEACTRARLLHSSLIFIPRLYRKEPDINIYIVTKKSNLRVFHVFSRVFASARRNEERSKKEHIEFADRMWFCNLSPSSSLLFVILYYYFIVEIERPRTWGSIENFR